MTVMTVTGRTPSGSRPSRDAYCAPGTGLTCTVRLKDWL
jgi:hypothetical protein